MPIFRSSYETPQVGRHSLPGLQLWLTQANEGKVQHLSTIGRAEQSKEIKSKSMLCELRRPVAPCLLRMESLYR
jgi:hypothetical protein